MSLSPNTTLAHYTIVSKIGAGGMGEVYRARDTRLDREVAIKLLPAEVSSDSDRLQRFEQEARATSALIPRRRRPAGGRPARAWKAPATRGRMRRLHETDLVFPCSGR